MKIEPSVVIGGATGALGAAFLLTRNGIYMPIRHRQQGLKPLPLPPLGPLKPKQLPPPVPDPLEEPKPLPLPPLPPLEPKADIKPFGGGAPSINDYPWGEPTVYTHTSPTPSTIYAVKAGDTHEWIVRQATGAALALADRVELVPFMNPNNAGYSEPWAKNLRRKMSDAIVCGWFNDTLSGQNDPQKAGGQLGMGPQGRGLNYLPRHADNLALLADGKSARRTTTINGNRQVGVLVADSNKYMQMWIPAPNLSKLQGPKETIDLVFDQQWSNGTFTLNPPPPITDPLGIDDAIFVGGCPGWDQ